VTATHTRRKRVWEIYDMRDGRTESAGYTEREAQFAIAWKWNTGGDTTYLAIRRTPSDLRSHEPPRNSGEGTAVKGPMPLAGGDESHTVPA
jgi:hypothetical protein